MFTGKRPLILAGIWLLFMLSLAVWWMIFAIRQTEVVMQAGLGEAAERQQTMLIGEGIFLIVGLLAGGIALMIYANREARRHRRVEEFFAAFAHDLKTSLASLRLQIESLREDLTEDSPLVDRLLRDSVNLQLQLENSLYMSSRKHQKIFKQAIPLSKTIGTVRHDWPDLELTLQEDPVVAADIRALESVVRNIVANAVVHGKASQLRIECERRGNSRVRIVFEDNGRGSGSKVKVGEPALPKPKGTTGMGLYIANQLMRSMGGSLEILPGGEKQGFRVALQMEAAPA